MKNLILVALILQLVITIVDSQNFKFGDIISFPPVCENGITYKHFAVYVGNKYPGKEDRDYIFHRLKNGALPTKPLCVFSPLNMNDEPELSNYLDGLKDKNGAMYMRAPDSELLKRIQELVRDCGPYGVLDNNCEHLATYVRYGLKISLQFGLTGEGMCINSINTKDLYKYMREIGSPAGSRPGSPAGSRPGSPSGSRPGSPSGSRPGRPSGSRSG